MNRRISLPLVVATGLLTAGSIAPRLGSVNIDPRIADRFADAMVMARNTDVMPAAAIAGAVLLAMILIAIIRSRQSRPVGLGLDLALASGEAIPATAGLSRKVAVAHLADSGRSIPAIARETRLAQDAVRGLVRRR